MRFVFGAVVGWVAGPSLGVAVLVMWLGIPLAIRRTSEDPPAG
jgi:hypothetical protein